MRLPAEPRLRDWLSAEGSLTWRIKRACTGFRVNRLRQQPARPHLDEAGLIGVAAGRVAMVREVILFDSERPLIFGHSIVALDSLDGPWRTLRGLGNRPLAEALYVDPTIRRDQLAYRRLDVRHPLYRRVLCEVGALPSQVWARRSLFYRGEAPLLVTEVFLPEILRLPAR